MKCEFCGYEGNNEIEVYDYERYDGMNLCDRCVDKFDFINNGHNPDNTWSDEYSIKYNIPPFPIKESYPSSKDTRVTKQKYGRR